MSVLGKVHTAAAVLVNGQWVRAESLGKELELLLEGRTSPERIHRAQVERDAFEPIRFA